MSNSDPRSWLDRAVGACFAVLVGAAAIYIAVRLIEAVWNALLVILLVGGLVALGVIALRTRSRGW
jgi:hypothetical protein